MPQNQTREADLCNLFMNIKLDSVSRCATYEPSIVLTTLSSKDHVHAKRDTARPLDDVVMSDAETEQVRSSSLVCHPNGGLTELLATQSDADSDCSAHGATGSACSQSPPLHGCAFLQVVQQQLVDNSFECSVDEELGV